MDSEDTVSENNGGRINFSTKGNVYEKYLNKKLIWFGTLLGFPSAVILCTIQILLMVTFIPKEMPSYELLFEYSGIGIIAAVTYFIASTITIKTLRTPTYVKFWLTLTSQLISLGVGLGLFVFAKCSPMELSEYRKRQLKYCNCLDEGGNIARNGTDPTYWYCQENKLISCVVMDERIKDLNWEISLLWSMIGAAGVLCVSSIIPFLFSVRTLISIGDVFDKVAKLECKNDSVGENAYTKWFPIKTIYIFGWIQFGLAMLTMLLSMSTRNNLGFDVFQFCAVGSFALLNWMSTNKPELSYHRLGGIGFLHLMIFVSTIGCLVAMDNANLFPFLVLETGFSGFIFFASLRPIFKVDDLVRKMQN